MNGNRILSGYLYIGSAVMLLLINIFIILPGYGQYADDYSFVLPLIAAELVCLIIALAVRRWKTDSNAVYELFQALTIPLMIAVLLKLVQPKWIVFGLVGAAILSAIYLAAVLWYNVFLNSKIKYSRYIQKCICFSLYRIRAVLFWFISLVLLIAIGHFIASPTHMTVILEKEVVMWSESRTIEANYDTCAKTNIFQELSPDEKEESVLCTTDIVTNYLRIPYKVNVRIKPLKGNVVADYSNSSRTITIDDEYLETCSGREIVDTIAHECYHARENYLIALFDRQSEEDKAFLSVSPEFYYIEDYKNELKHYKTEGEEYANQQVEIQARLFAEDFVEDWFGKLEEIRAKNGSSQK